MCAQHKDWKTRNNNRAQWIFYSTVFNTIAKDSSPFWFEKRKL